MILSIDPGGVTGIAHLTRGGHFGTDEIQGGADGMIPWLEMMVDTLPTMNPNGAHDIDAIVCETFVPRPGAKSTQLDALHIIGMLRYLCKVYDTPLIMQSPAQAKSFATNEKLKAVGWYTVGEDHGRDAARHLLVFLAGNNGLPVAFLSEKVRILTALASL